MASIFIGARSGGAAPQQLELKRANRHGLIAGATGTGKTVTLQGRVEGFSAVGVPTFVADVKGDLAGLAMAGSPTAKTHEIFAARAAELGITDWQYRDCPVQFWDLFGEQGHPIRTTVSEMGPLLLARLMNLNEVQEGVLTIGALTRHADLLKAPEIAAHAPLLTDAVAHVAHPAIRNRGTIGGSLAHADPASELPACMLTLGATIIACGPGGERRGRAYLRFTVADRVGVLAEIAAAMRDAGVSIESLIQRGAMADGSVLVAIVTHEGPERSVAQALEKLRGSQSLVGQPLWMHILG